MKRVTVERDPNELNRRQLALLERVAAHYHQAGCTPPYVVEASRAMSVPPDAVTAMLLLGEQRGLFVRVTETLWFHADAMARAEAAVREIAECDGSVSVGAFRDATGSSRKYVVPLLEHFDATGVTRRDGDLRVLAVEPAHSGHDGDRPDPEADLIQ